MFKYAVVIAAMLFGMSDAGFKCCRDISKDKDTNMILNLTSVTNGLLGLGSLTLESVCLNSCQQENCSCADNAAGLLGQVTGGVAGALVDIVNPLAQCILNPNKDGSNPNKLSDNTACMIPCILDLNLLDICDVQAIVTSLIKICPKQDVKGLCVSACLCCGVDSDPLDVCVNACLTNKGLGLTINNGQGGTSIGGVNIPKLPTNGELLGGSGSGGLGGLTGAAGGLTNVAGGAGGLTNAAGGLTNVAGGAGGLTNVAGGLTGGAGGAGGLTSGVGGVAGGAGGAGGLTGGLGL